MKFNPQQKEKLLIGKICLLFLLDWLQMISYKSDMIKLDYFKLQKNTYKELLIADERTFTLICNYYTGMAFVVPTRLVPKDSVWKKPRGVDKFSFLPNYF